jgi:hypothetical protein
VETGQELGARKRDVGCIRKRRKKSPSDPALIAVLNMKDATVIALKTCYLGQLLLHVLRHLRRTNAYLRSRRSFRNAYETKTTDQQLVEGRTYTKLLQWYRHAPKILCKSSNGLDFDCLRFSSVNVCHILENGFFLSTGCSERRASAEFKALQKLLHQVIDPASGISWNFCARNKSKLAKNYTPTDLPLVDGLTEQVLYQI